MDILKRVQDGDKRAAARLISMLENKEREAFEIIKKLYPKGGNAYVVGITGPPGAGKSTLTDKLTRHARSLDLNVGIVAIDPTIPFTGGAIGDRVRMGSISNDPGVFIRSMGARGHLGGISEGTSAAVKVLDVYGADIIFVETVGVGQSEVDIVKNCDTTLMVMVPGLGDDIQAIKAGVMEIGDVFAINKADRDGAKKTAREINMMLDYNKTDWRPPVTMVIAVENDGVKELYKTIEDHRKHLEDSGKLMLKRTENSKNELIELVKHRVISKILDRSYNEVIVNKLSSDIASRVVDPYSACELLYEEIKK